MENKTVQYAMTLITTIAVVAMLNMTLLTIYGYSDSPVMIILSNVVSAIVGAIAGWVIAPRGDNKITNSQYPEPPVRNEKRNV